jgi:predicted GNAT family acetyltransferase
MTEPVRDNPERHRFELDTEAGPALAVYRREGNMLAVYHTETPLTLRGRGIASALVTGVMDYARAHGLKIAPRCPFVVAFMDKHPEYADLRA